MKTISTASTISQHHDVSSAAGPALQLHICLEIIDSPITDLNHNLQTLRSHDEKLIDSRRIRRVNEALQVHTSNGFKVLRK